MKALRLRELSDEELAQQLSESQGELLNLRVQQSLGQAEKPVRIRGIRRDIARIRTLMAERAGAQS